MRLFRSIWTLQIVLAVSVPASRMYGQDVAFNYDRNTDFSKYRTYTWVQVPDTAKLDQLQDQQVRASIDTELAKRGLMKVDAQGDLSIAYQPAISQEKQFNSYSTGTGPGWGYGPGWGGWYGGGGFSSTITSGQTTTIQIGALGLDMYDSAKHQLVWRGEVSKTLDPKAKPDKKQKNLNKAVAKLLKNYPPPAKKES